MSDSPVATGTRVMYHGAQTALHGPMTVVNYEGCTCKTHKLMYTLAYGEDKELKQVLPTSFTVIEA